MTKSQGNEGAASTSDADEVAGAALYALLREEADSAVAALIAGGVLSRA